MLTRIFFCFSSSKKSLPFIIQANLEFLNNINQCDAEIAKKIIKIYHNLQIDVKQNKVSANWNIDPTINKSLNILTPQLKSLEDRQINSLILTLNFLGIVENPIWKTLENLFIKTSHKSLERFHVPVFISAFSMVKSTDLTLWNILNKQLLAEIQTRNDVSILNILLAYKSLLLNRKGSPEVLALLKQMIIKKSCMINSTLIVDLLHAIVKSKTMDRELTNFLISRIMEKLDKMDPNTLCTLIFNFVILKENLKELSDLEKKILDNIQTLSLKSLASCLSVYCKGEMLRKGDPYNFPRSLFNYYLENRTKLKNEVDKPITSIGYDIKILSSGLELGYAINDETFLSIFQEIKSFKSFEAYFQRNMPFLEKYYNYISIKKKIK